MNEEDFSEAIQNLKKIENYFDIKDLVKNVEGWLTIREGISLYEIAKHCKKGSIVEIGSWKGKSTIWLAKGSLKGNKVPIYAIDPHIGSKEHKKMFNKDSFDTFEDFKKNINKANCSDIIIPIREKSEDVHKKWEKSISLLFIDGAHDFDSVNNDFMNFSKYLIKGGIIAFHDYGHYEGIKKVVESIKNSKEFEFINLLGSIIFFKKIKK